MITGGHGSVGSRDREKLGLNSQISICMRGKHEPKTAFFQALARFNKSVHTGQYMQQGITDRLLIDRLNAGKACATTTASLGVLAIFNCSSTRKMPRPGLRT